MATKRKCVDAAYISTILLASAAMASIATANEDVAMYDNKPWARDPHLVVLGDTMILYRSVAILNEMSLGVT